MSHRSAHEAPAGATDDKAAVTQGAPAAKRAAGAVSVEQVVREALTRIHATESLHAWTYVDEAGALERALALDRQELEPRAGPGLRGVAVGVKDSIAVAGMPFEAGSDLFRGAVARHDAAVVAALRDHGAVPLGMTAMHALGLGDAVEFGHRRTSRHPWHDDYVPSGSSSGAAVATAAGACALAIGGDTGGSVRGPAASCGVLGLKPTWGSIDASGTTPMAWSMDTVGFFTRELKVLRQVCAALDLVPATPTAPASQRIGAFAPEELPGLSAEMRDLYADARQRLTDAGHQVVSVPLPPLEAAPAIWLARMGEFRAVLAREMAIAPERVPESMHRVFAAAVQVSQGDYRQSWNAAAELTDAVDEALANVEVLLLPATPTRTLTWASWTGSGLAGSEVWDWYRYLLPFNVTGHPAMTVPWQLLDGAVPAAVQLVARHDGESALLSAALGVQAVSRWPGGVPHRVRELVHAQRTQGAHDKPDPEDHRGRSGEKGE